MEKEFTVIAYTENFVGLLNRITIVFTRRKINIESLTVCSSEIKGIHRFTIVVNTSENQIIKVTKQIERMVDVLRASYFEEKDIIHQEVALYKIPTIVFENGNVVETLIRRNSARVLRIERDYVVIEKTGHEQETQELFDSLEPYGILQFVRSGRIAVTKELKEMTTHLKEIENREYYSVIAQPEK